MFATKLAHSDVSTLSVKVSRTQYLVIAHQNLVGKEREALTIGSECKVTQPGSWPCSVICLVTHLNSTVLYAVVFTIIAILTCLNLWSKSIIELGVLYVGPNSIGQVISSNISIPRPLTNTSINLGFFERFLPFRKIMKYGGCISYIKFPHHDWRITTKLSSIPSEPISCHNVVNY